MNQRADATLRKDDSGYLFDNAGNQTAARFEALSTLYDCRTKGHLEALGVRQGWQCLEIGGGGGSIATWLADRVGVSGRVLATDIDPRFLETASRQNLEVRRHDIACDPLPEKTFDLIHARLVLIHVQHRESALQRMVASLKPGGWLMDEEFDSASLPPDQTLDSGEALLKAHVAFTQYLSSGGVDRRFGRLMPAAFGRHGLVDLCAEAALSMWRSGSPGISLMRANYEQARAEMISAGYLTEVEFEQDMARLDDPGFMMPSPIMWTVCGRRPM